MPANNHCQVCSGGLTAPCSIDYGRLYSCRKCGARFLTPATTKEYDGQYYESWFGEPGQNIQRIKRDNFRILLRSCFSDLSGKKLLDVGCATGFLMQEARAAGAKVSGIDVSKWATAQAGKVLPDAAIYTGTLHEALARHFFDEGTFDIITATDVIEHVSEVRPFLRDLLFLLAPNGTVIFTLPDPDSLSCRMMGKAWFQYKVEHLTFLSRKSLGILAGELGFNIEEIRPHRKILTPEYVFNVLRCHNSGVLNNLSRLAGKAAKICGLARLPLSLGTGEMLVKINKQKGDSLRE